MDERTRRFGAGLCAVRTAACLRRRPKAGGGAICTQGGPGGRPQGSACQLKDEPGRGVERGWRVRTWVLEAGCGGAGGEAGV